MKKKIFRSPKYIIAFVLGAIVFSVIGVKAATMLVASEVAYDNSNSSLQATNVQGAVDELYTKAASKEKLCKKGYYTTGNESSNYTCTKIVDNESVITITANGSGTINFFSDNYSGTMPDYVYVDGTSITPVKSYNFATGGNHTIVLKWNDSTSVNSMAYMFSECSSLTSLDLSNMDTSSVNNMKDMFSGCSSLTSLDLSGFNTSSVNNMNSMFSGCSSLTSLDLSGFDTSNVVFMNNMFYDHASGLQIKATSATCNKIASNSRITGNYTCTQ